MNKFELTDETTVVDNIKLYRIRALQGIKKHNVKKGDLGGFVQSVENLSQDGDCWVFGEARVFGEAVVCGEARVYDKAMVCGKAVVRDKAWVCEEAQVCGKAVVLDEARVGGEAQVFGEARVGGEAWIYGEALVRGRVRVYGEARVYGKARVYGESVVCGEARVYGKAWIGEEIYIKTDIVDCDVTRNKNPEVLLKASCFAAVFDKKTILYKRVNRTKKKNTYKSIYDGKFLYKVGKVANVKNYDKSMISCSDGIHISHPAYWKNGDTLIAVEVLLKDIITIQMGKVRCRKVKVLGECK